MYGQVNEQIAIQNKEIELNFIKRYQFLKHITIQQNYNTKYQQKQ